jgi:Kef-type K+ transport system membrane component KefB/nucleotide-binding universal stress UspA family protein
MPVHPTRTRSSRPMRRFAWGGAWGCSLLLAGSAAWSAEPGSTASGASEVIFLAEIVLLLLVGRLLGEAMQRIGQPAVIGQLLAGILLGPSVFGTIWPEAQHAIFPASGPQKSMLDAVSQLGILMLLLLTGMETNLSLVRQVGRAAASISIAGIALPFACGFTLGEFLPDGMLPKPDQRLITSLFLGTALSISSVKIVAMVVREMNFMRRNVGQIIVASAIIDDTIGWIIIAITFGLAQHGTLDLATLARSLLGTALFLALSLTVGRRIVFSLIRWTNDNFVSEVPVITVILVIMGAMALTTHLLGVHTVLGAFVAGILVGESPILTRHIDEQLRGLITALFAPVFFGVAGLGTDLSVLKDPSLGWLMLALIAIASLGKFSGAFIGGRLGGLSFRESLALGCAMNARGSTEVMIATIGLSLGMLSHSLFTMIVAMAVVTTMAMPPTLRWALGRLPLGEEEKRRLEREEFEAKGFVSNMERLLIAVDDSPNGQFASRLAGLIAASRGMPATVVPARPAGSAAERAADEASTERAIQAAAQAARPAETEQESGARAKLSVITRAGDAPPEETVASEARKGYDLLVIGIEHVARRKEFHEDVNRIAAGFDGPLAIVDARGIHLERPLQSPLNILVPVTGTEASRRAAEIGIAIAQALGAPVTALYVSTGRSKRAARSLRNALGSRRQHEAILRDVVEMADRYDVDIRTDVKIDVAADDAILRHANANRATLIVMGVNRRPGDTLFFGNVAAAVLEKSRRSILFISGSGSIGPAQPAGKQPGKPVRATAK